MDINMPFKSGLEAKKEVSELFKNSNKDWSEGTLADKVSQLKTQTKVSTMRPFICYQT